MAGYGAFALEQFVGTEMYRLILPDDPTRWPMTAFVTLPLVPLTLIAQQTPLSRSLPLGPLLCSFPSMPGKIVPATDLGSKVTSLIRGLQPLYLFNSVRDMEIGTLKDMFFSWPPSPFMFHFMMIITQRLYGNYRGRLRRWVLGPDADTAGAGGEGAGGGLPGGNALGEFRFELRIEGDEEDEQQGQDNPPPEPVPQIVEQPVIPDNNAVQLVLDGANPDPVGNVQPPVAEPAPAPADPPRAGNQPEPNPNPNPNDDARNRLRLTGGKVGRLVGGALILPTISSLMGSLLLRLALPSSPNAHQNINALPRPSGFSPQYLLRRFLAIRPPGSANLGAYTYIKSNLASLTVLELLRFSVAVGNRIIFVGSPVWTMADPVWYYILLILSIERAAHNDVSFRWRNAVGLGLWFVAKDCVSLWHEWLSQREVKSRKVKSRSFEGIDPKELDLKPSAARKLGLQ